MIAEPSMPERRPSPGLTLNLNSNNPFRNRTGSPSLNTPTSAGSRPMSRNPFLSTFEAEFNKEASNPQLIDMSATLKESPKKATFGNTAEELFNNLTLDDKNEKNEKREKRDASRGPPPPRGGHGHSSSRGHRPSRSSEEEERRMRGPPRGPPRPRPPPGSRPHGNSPDRKESRRPRRNSESSMIDKGSLDPEEERRRRERRRQRDERSKDSKSKSGRVRRPQGLDLIDKLDVTGIYGPSMIHHDGPYDAVQPHRNRKKDHRAPMQAFPVGSANNALGGAGPVNKNIDLDTFHGRGAEGFTDFNAGAIETKKRGEASFDAKGRADIVHGEETVGLGTSTFLDGAPASRAAIQRGESENQTSMEGGGLGRKKSIAQRFRGISQQRRFGEGGRITSPEARYGGGSPNSPHALTSPHAVSAGGMSKANEKNPFFDDYDAAYEKKGASIKIAEPESRDTAVKSPSSPGGRNPLTRSITADSPEASASKPNGFLTRMKSLKGGRRARPERPAA